MSSVRSESIRSRMHNPFHNPLPASLSKECKKAGKILNSFINPKEFGTLDGGTFLDGGVPRSVLSRAKGLVIFTSLKAGFLGSVRFGSGLIVARLADGTWSAPSAIATGGIGVGGQFGMELTDFVFVVNTEREMKKFAQGGSLTLSGNISIAFGPIGRSGEAGTMASSKGFAGMYAYSKTRGMYGGLTLEGGVLGERASANKKMYGRKVTPKQLLGGEVPPPPEAEPLMCVLRLEAFTAEPTPAGVVPELVSGQPHEQAAELHSERPTEPPEGIFELPAEYPVSDVPDTPDVPATQPDPGNTEPGTENQHEISENSTTNPNVASQELVTPGEAPAWLADLISKEFGLPSEEPVPSAEKPVPSAEKPVPSSEKPAMFSEKPAPSSDKPVQSSHNPTASTASTVQSEKIHRSSITHKPIPSSSVESSSEQTSWLDL
ncbi:hypothetical protein N7474_005686 [Penicillium riverlandense]|uniref:uncharacterized protein n=1 Tax=Penicillium riverlandense TaxID=1903569 RepID=UPI002547527E|nr:uncharacterized protein N7474_005686 [Penicillium riverlandense]KAJ5820095.1 hypothetical protein N7474_005686 [Penicillium riverlandense]